MSFACIKEGKEFHILNFKVYVFVNHFYDIYVIKSNISKYNHPNKSWDFQNCEKYYLLTFSIIAGSS